MKKLLLSFVAMATLVTVACSQTPAAKDSANVVITFATTEHDFGQIEQGSDGTFVFTFENTGKDPLIVSNARASCGCTTPEWTSEPVARHKKGAIKVKYNTNIIGTFTKNVTVYSNASNSPITLKIKGSVVPKPQNNTPQSSTTPLK
jgi:hypothetical protein